MKVGKPKLLLSSAKSKLLNVSPEGVCQSLPEHSCSRQHTQTDAQ